MSEAAVTDAVSISASAARRLNAILNGEEGAAMRISVKGGGCSGFQYAFDIDRTRADDDLIITRDGATVLIDPISLEMMKGGELDFVDDLMGQAFKIKNPNAVASCGCGHSFQVAEGEAPEEGAHGCGSGCSH
jgi:iron-sulfur cluster insertion protein